MGKRRLELVLEAEASASDSKDRRESVAAVGVYTSGKVHPPPISKFSLPRSIAGSTS